MNIAVCVKQVVDTEAEKKLDPASWRLDRSVTCILNPYDEYAVEEALRIKEAARRRSHVASAWARRRPTTPCARPWPWAPTTRCWSATRRWPAPTRRRTAYVLAEALKTVPVRPGALRRAGPPTARPAACRRRWPSASACRCSRPWPRSRSTAPRCTVHRETEQGYVAYECPTPGRDLGDQGHQRAALPLDEGHHERQEEARRQARTSPRSVAGRGAASGSPAPRPACSPAVRPSRARRA